MIFDFDEFDWFNNMYIFFCWMQKEQEKCKPRGACGQSMFVTSGYDALMRKYPTFESAYEEYKRLYEEKHNIDPKKWE